MAGGTDIRSADVSLVSSHTTAILHNFIRWWRPLHKAVISTALRYGQGRVQVDDNSFSSNGDGEPSVNTDTAKPVWGRSRYSTVYTGSNKRERETAMKWSMVRLRYTYCISIPTPLPDSFAAGVVLLFEAGYEYGVPLNFGCALWPIGRVGGD